MAAGWEYRWGDSPVETDGARTWARGEALDTGWQPIARPSNPPGRGGQRLVWYRIRLPRAEVADARLFVYSIDLAAELYLDGRLLYRWGEARDGGRLEFRGWPWHLVSLPAGYGGKLLYVRAASDYHDIGLWGDVLIDSGLGQIARMTRRDVPRLLAATLSLLIAAVFAALYCRRREPALLLLALVTAVLVLRVVSQTQVKQLFFDAPLFWEYLKTTTSLLVAVLIARLVHELLAPRYRIVTRVITDAQAILLGLVLLASATGIVRLCDTYQTLDLVAIGSMLLLGALSVRGALAGDGEARLLTVNFLVFGLLVFYSILVSNGMLPWSDEIDYLLLFQFSLGLAFILGRRLLRFQRRLEEYAHKLASQADEMRALNDRLEHRVAERTRQLERANRRLRGEKISLQITSITDGLTGLYSRTYALDRFEKELGKARRYRKRLSIVMLDLDQFKQVNDSFGHQAGDLVMQRVGGLLRDILRESDLAGRYGGEEFLIVLPEADAQEAGQVAERIRSEIEASAWPHRDMRVTVSGGVAQFAGETADQLLQRADYLLYRAKETGRNRIMTETFAVDLHRSSS